ncbi:MAG: hypothetical protein RLZZ501_408 [Pseudomonadota bacterium]|jgi:transposase InsO family protein
MKEWFTAAEIAALKLPGMPESESGVWRIAKRDGWQHPERQCDVVTNPRGVWRTRDKKQGGGTEYHYSLLPSRAQAALVRKHHTPTEPTRAEIKQRLSSEEAWSHFEGLPEARKDKARTRLKVLQDVDALIRAGTPKEVAIQLICGPVRIPTRTYYEWETRVHGVERPHWLPHLADRYVGRTVEAEITPEAWEAFKADYLRLEQPSAKSCYDRLVRAGRDLGWVIPSSKTLLRRIESEIALPVRVLTREGVEALKRLYPPQRRDRSMFHALEAINGDGHRFDVFVKWPDGEIGRPMMCTFQDLYSGKVVGWRVDKSENRDAIRLALGDVIEDYGIPDHIWFDNTRAFANKALTAGSQTRFRFKIRDEDPVGLCVQLGIEVHFTLPYSGQSKPIERAFRDMCDRIARHPAFAGAYTGNSPVTKPENYGAKAVPIDEFLKVLSAELAAHNAQAGRRSQVCDGRLSFDEAFAASYAASPIRKATAAQRRLWLLAAEGVRASTARGEITLFGNRYWTESLLDHRGQPLIARFDPHNLLDDLHVYRLDGAYIGAAEVVEAVGFADAGAARDHARARRAFIKATRAYAEAEIRLSAAEVAALAPIPGDLPAPEAKVVRMPSGTPAPTSMGQMRRKPLQPAPITPAEQARLTALEAELAPAEVVPLPTRETRETRFARALDLERQREAGQPIGDAEAGWLAVYRTQPEYRAMAKLYEDFGDAVLTA